MEPELLSTEPKSGGLRAYVDLIEKHRSLVIAITAVFSICGALIYASMPNEYAAQAQVLVEKLDNTRGAADQNRELLLPSMNAENDYIVTQTLIMTSDKILGRAVEKAGLTGQVRLVSARSHSSPGILTGLQGKDRAVYKAEALNTRGSRLIVLRVNGPDPELCRTLANAVVDGYLQENARENLVVSQQAYRWLMDEAAGVEGLDSAKKEAMVASLERIMKDPDIQRLESQKIQIISELRSASQKYLPKHPMIQQIGTTLDKINSDIQERREVLTSNLKDALAGGGHISNVRVLDHASLPENPVAPDRFMGWLFTTLVGFLSSVIFLSVRESLNRTIRTESDMPAEFKVPCLGAIPSAKGLKKTIGKHNAKTFIHVLEDDLELRDAIVSIRTHILFSMPFEKSRKIMFAGATPDKEESAVPILTALSMATMGRDIVLVDADLRNPRIHSDLGLEPGRGLADYLTGEAALEDVVRTVPGSNLKVIAGGMPNINSSGLLATPRFDELMKKLTEKYDRVFLNVPPILYVPDAMIVAKNVSCVVLVCSSGVTKKESVLSAIDKFITMDRPLMGYVINRVLRDRELKGQVEKDYKDYKNNYLQLQAHPSTKAPAATAVSSVPGVVQRKVN